MAFIPQLYWAKLRLLHSPPRVLWRWAQKNLAEDKRAGWLHPKVPGAIFEQVGPGPQFYGT